MSKTFFVTQIKYLPKKNIYIFLSKNKTKIAKNICCAISWLKKYYLKKNIYH